MLSTTSYPRIISPLVSGSRPNFPFIQVLKEREKNNILRKKKESLTLGVCS